MNEEQLAEHLDEVNRVAAEYLKGRNETEISHDLAIPRSRVVKHLNEWKTAAANNEAVRQRARQALAGADQHYNALIRHAYDTVEDADQGIVNGGLNQNQGLTIRLQALKMVADLEKNRMEMLQKAGLLENQELADQLMEQERIHEELMKIITDVVGTCPVCKPKVLQRMSGLKDEPVVIIEGGIDG